MDNQSEKKIIHDPDILEPDSMSQDFSRSSNGTGNFARANFVSFYSANQNGCLATAVTFTLFLISLSQFGILAAIGFLFYHVILSIAGSIIATRKLVNGRPFNLWAWRFVNWTLSFALVAWQSGALD